MAALFAAYLAGYGIFIPFFPVWLDAQGLTAGWIAVLVAIPLVVRVLTTSLVSDGAERFDDPRLPLVGLSFLAAVVFSVLPLAMAFAPDPGLASNPWFLLVLVAVMAIGWNAVLPLSDALGIQVARSTDTAYGTLRVWGSIAFIVASFAAGLIVERYGAFTIPWMIIFALILLVLACAALPRSVAHVPSASSPVVKRRSGWVFFLRRKGAMSVFIGAGLMQASHAVFYGFGSLSWAAQGFSETMIGLLWSFGVLCEIILFAVSGAIVSRIGARGLLLLGGLGATLRWVLFAFEPSLAMTWGLQILHAFSFGMTHLAVIAYTTKRARLRELRGAQGVFGVIAGGIMAAAILVAGPLYSAFGAMAYLAMGVMTAAGVLIIFFNRLRVPAGDVRTKEIPA